MDHLQEIRREADRFYELAATADPAAAVPSCPDWTVADLVWHLGEVHWFWGTDIEDRATDPDAIGAVKPARLDGAFADLVAWSRAQTDRMIGLLESTADDVRVWTWALAEADQTVGFIRRHQVQEGAIHRWDLEGAIGTPSPIDPASAADAIDEFLSVSLPWSVNDEKPIGGTVHIHCTDVEGEWFISANGAVERIHAKGDVAIRGTASDILLALYKRSPIVQLDVIGDAGLADQLVGAVHTG